MATIFISTKPKKLNWNWKCFIPWIHFNSNAAHQTQFLSKKSETVVVITEHWGIWLNFSLHLWIRPKSRWVFMNIFEFFFRFFYTHEFQFNTLPKIENSMMNGSFLFFLFVDKITSANVHTTDFPFLCGTKHIFLNGMTVKKKKQQ